MQLPNWFPQSPRPWNPAFAEVWDVMSPNQRRWDLLIDIALCAIILCAVGAVFWTY